MIMKITNIETEFLRELLNNYIVNHNLDDEIYLDQNGELTQLWFDHKEHHDTPDIRAYRITNGLLDKLY